MTLKRATLTTCQHPRPVSSRTTSDARLTVFTGREPDGKHERESDCPHRPIAESIMNNVKKELSLHLHGAAGTLNFPSDERLSAYENNCGERT